MILCAYDGCSWQSIAPAEEAARQQYAEHIVSDHAETIDVDIPDGMVQIKLGEDGDWITTTREAARMLHDQVHGD